jgi:hypothetical protein
MDDKLADYQPVSVYDAPQDINLAAIPKIEGLLSMELLSENWLGFCNVIKQNKRVLYGYLSLCNPIKLDGDLLTLSVESDNKIQYEQLSKPENKRMLEDSLKSYYGSGVRLALIQRKAASRGASNFIQNTDPDKFFENAPDGKDLFEKLGGEIIGQ